MRRIYNKCRESEKVICRVCVLGNNKSPALELIKLANKLVFAICNRGTCVCFVIVFKLLQKRCSSLYRDALKGQSDTFELYSGFCIFGYPLSLI